MMTWYSIIQYCIPNNISMMLMLNLMSGGSWHKLSFKKKCKKNWLHIEVMKLPIKNIYLPSRKPFQISFIAIQIVQNHLVLYWRWKKLSIVDQLRTHNKKNHKSWGEEDKIF